MPNIKSAKKRVKVTATKINKNIHNWLQFFRNFRLPEHEDFTLPFPPEVPHKA